MVKTINRLFRKLFSKLTLSYLLIFTTLFNSFAPALSLITPVHAEESSAVSITYQASSHNLALTGTGSYHLYYQSGDQTELVAGILPSTVFIGSKSSDGSTAQLLDRGIVKTDSETLYFVVDLNQVRLVASTLSTGADLTSSQEIWLTTPSTYGDLVTGVTYHADFNNDVSVTFSSLPENPGTVTFHQVELTPEQVKESGALTSHAYEITSSMADGTFAYNLTLPNPSNKTSVGVQYSDDGSSFDETSGVTASSSLVTISNLTHFTIFVVVYDSLPSVVSTNHASLGFQATQTSEFGDYIHLAGSSRLLSSVTVTMSDWAKFSDYSSDTRYMSDSNFWVHPITINIYSSELKADGTPATKLGSITRDISIPWRPEASIECGTAWKSTDGNCYNGLAFNAVFDMSSLNLTLPDDIIVGVAYNTNTWGYSPIGLNGPYESLNVAVPANQTVSVGSDDSVNEVFWNTVTKAWYSDNGASGFGVFRKDSNWSPNGTVAFKVETIDTTPACSDSTFDGFTLGSVNGQNGWQATGPFDQAIVNNSYGYTSFGCKTLRFSDSITSGSFGDQIFATPLTNGAGENAATAGSFSVGERKDHFEAQFDIASAKATQQTGMHTSISPDRGDGSRMSYLRVEDNAGGLDMFFDDVQTTTNPADWTETKIASNLDRTIPHTVKFVMDFKDGPSNDVVKVYVDGALAHTGTSWENYYRYDTEASSEQSPRLVKTLLFRQSGTAHPDNSGKGFLIDNVSLTSSLNDTTAPTTPTLLSPANGVYRHTSDANYSDWSDITDPSGVGYRYQSASDIAFTNLYYDSNNYGPLLSNSMIMNPGEPEVSYYWRVQACDNVGNCSAWTTPWLINIDNTSPSIPVLTWPIDGTATNDNTPLMQWNDSTDNTGVAGYLYRVYYHCSNPSDFSTCSQVYPSTVGLWLTASQYQAGATADGVYYWQVRAQDNAGNQSAWSEAEKVTLDATAPAVPTLTSPSNNAFLNTHNFTFTWGSVADVSSPVTYEWESSYGTGTKVDGSFTSRLAFHSLTTPSVYSPSTPDNAYYWHVRALDSAGNASAWSNVWKVTVDTVAPSAPNITIPTAEQYFKTSPILNRWDSVTDASGIKQYTVEYIYDDGHTFSGAPYRVTTTNSRNHSPAITEQGGVTIRVRAEDNAGNIGPWSEAVHYTYDATAPVLTGKSTFEGWFNEAQLSEFTYADSMSPINSGLPVSCNITTEGASQTCAVTPHVCDTAGNCNNITVTSNGASIDFTMPESTINSPSNEGTDSTIYTNAWDGVIAGTATDALSGVHGVQVSIKKGDNQYFDGEGFVDSESEILLDTTYAEGSWTYAGLISPVEDSYTIKSHAIDNAGNVESTYSLTVIYDKSIPEVKIELSPSTPDAGNGWYKTQPEIKLTATDSNLDIVEYQWDSQTGAWSNYSSAFKPESEGSHILYYRAHDLADNYSETGVKSVKWDKTGLTKGPQNVSVSPNPTASNKSTVTWDEASDALGIEHYDVQWKLGDTVYIDSVASNIRSHELSKLTEGEWTVTVKAFDGAGNSQENSVNLTVDRTPPSAPTLALTGTGAGSVSLSWNSVSGANKYLIWYGTSTGEYLYGANVGNVTSYTVQGLGSGNYYFIIRAHDAAGNGSGNSNEVSTGTITGAPGVTPGAPAAQFTTEPSVLGANTDKTEENSTQVGDAGSVLGDKTSKNWYWLLLLVLPFGYLIYRRLKKTS